MTGRTIRMFLVDGTPSGIKTAEIGLSTVKAVMGLRPDLPNLGKRPEAQRTGVYLLLGPDEDTPGRLAIYVGEGDKVIKRLVSHDSNKDFWDKVVFFTSKDENLTKAHVRYLEASLVQQAKEAGRCTVMNATSPEGGALPEPDLAEMLEMIEQIRILLGTFGLNVFDPMPEVASPTIGNASAAPPAFQIAGKGFSGTFILKGGEFWVQRDSVARTNTAPALSKGSRALREELKKTGVLVQEAEGLVFKKDQAFSSASSAAQVVSGTCVNGRTSLRTEDGVTYADWQESQLKEQVGADLDGDDEMESA